MSLTQTVAGSRKRIERMRPLVAAIRAENPCRLRRPPDEIRQSERQGHQAHGLRRARRREGARRLCAVPARARRHEDRGLSEVAEQRRALQPRRHRVPALRSPWTRTAASPTGSTSAAPRGCTTSATRSTTSTRRSTHAQAQGAQLRICQACQKYGSHPHPEGWVAFLDNEAGGIEIEFMQVYTPEQLKEYEAFKGI